MQGARSLRGDEVALPGDDQQQDVEVRFGVGLDAPSGRDADEVGVELPAGFGEAPEGTGRRGAERLQVPGVAQDPRDGDTASPPRG